MIPWHQKAYFNLIHILLKYHVFIHCQHQQLQRQPSFTPQKFQVQKALLYSMLELLWQKTSKDFWKKGPPWLQESIVLYSRVKEIEYAQLITHYNIETTCHFLMSKVITKHELNWQIILEQIWKWPVRLSITHLPQTLLSIQQSSRVRGKRVCRENAGFVFAYYRMFLHVCDATRAWYFNLSQTRW